MAVRLSKPHLIIITFLSTVLLLFVSITNSYFYTSSLASEEAIDIAKDIGLTVKGENAFYKARPELASRQSIVSTCADHDTAAMILGCYIPDENRIYVISNRDQAFGNVTNVTAAHEMLHALYDQHPFWVKLSLNQLLDYELRNNIQLREFLAPYGDAEHDVLLDEAHSFLATQIYRLDPKLEAYYSKYFFDRRQIVRAYESVESIIATKQEKINEIEIRLNNLSMELNSYNEKYDECLSVNDIYCANSNARSYNTRLETYNEIFAEYEAEFKENKELTERYLGIKFKDNNVTEPIRL